LAFLLLFFVVALSIVKLSRGPRNEHDAAGDPVNSQWLYSHSLAESFSWRETPSLEGESSEWSEPASFIPWLRSRGITPDRVPFVTLGDRNYSRAHRNLRERLERWGYGRNTVVLCLDVECARDLPFGFGGFIGQSVAALKVRSASL
jgi:hypothetical protein